MAIKRRTKPLTEEEEFDRWFERREMARIDAAEEAASEEMERDAMREMFDDDDLGDIGDK